MWIASIRAALGAIALLGAASHAAQAQNTRDRVNAAAGALLQADGPGARALLTDLGDAALDDGAAEFRRCVLARLDGMEGGGSVAGNALAERALDAYRAYWRAAISDPSRRDAAERALALRLSDLLQSPPTDQMIEVEDELHARLTSEGLHVLGGRTGRLLDLMLWTKQEVREETADLPNGPQPVRVVLMDGFQSRGWSNWITCGRTGTGGWVGSDGLYAIVPAYPSLTAEDFRINFLAHEAQHFADNARFPGLSGWRLEYRAKLAELALANAEAGRTLARLSMNQGDDPNEPHSAANRMVLAVLRTRLGRSLDADLTTTPPARLRRVAREALEADTDWLSATVGAASVP